MKYLITCIFLLSLTTLSHAQEKDTVYVLFDQSYKEMKKASYLISPKTIKSHTYFIKQKEPANGYDDEFWFSHFNQPPKAYKAFGGKPPLKIVKDMSFLKTIKPLDIQFFRTTAYIKVCKTFEAEDSWEQDVIIFMIDKDEIKDGKIILREVKFSRPVKI